MCQRCSWANADQQMMDYHDNEWGVPLHDDKKLFEFLVLEGFQAGLSWQIVLNKRSAFRSAFDGFNPERVANYDADKMEELSQNSAIIRNRAKIAASVNNARCFLQVQKEFGSFDRYIWKFVGGRPLINTFEKTNDIPAHTSLSDKIAADLKKRGFKFVGSTIVYAHMQATGMVLDHLTSCFRYPEIYRIIHNNSF